MNIYKYKGKFHKARSKDALMRRLKIRYADEHAKKLIIKVGE